MLRDYAQEMKLEWPVHDDAVMKFARLAWFGASWN